MQLNPYLYFNGTCEAAFKFYAKALNGKIDAMFPHTGTPAEQHVPAEWRDKIMHAKLDIGGEVLMGSDVPPGQSEGSPRGYSVSLNVDKPAEAERVFKALSENGTVKMPLQKTFWAERFGMLVDQYGTPWMINCQAPSA